MALQCAHIPNPAADNDLRVPRALLLMIRSTSRDFAPQDEQALNLTQWNRQVGMSEVGAAVSHLAKHFPAVVWGGS